MPRLYSNIETFTKTRTPDLVYSMALSLDKQHVPLNSSREDGYKLNPNTELLQTCSQMYSEARSLMENITTAYIPVMPGMDWSLESPVLKDGITPEARVTIFQALTEFTNVHFHLHNMHDPGSKSYSSAKLLRSLEDALNVFISHSVRVGAKFKNRKRHAIVHLDHFLSIWAPVDKYDIGSYEHLISVMAKDVNTDWDIRYYVPINEATATDCPYKWHALDLAQLKWACKRYGEAHMTVLTVRAEAYGDHTWKLEGTMEEITREKTPCSSHWSPQWRFVLELP